MNEGRREGEKGETGRVRRRGLVSAVNGPCFVQCIVGAGGLFFFFEGGGCYLLVGAIRLCSSATVSTFDYHSL